MGLILRKLKLRIVTEQGLFGVEIGFAKGLVILRANNTCGKSTCINSIIYALGLELMLSPQREIPLPHVMTDYVDYNNEEIVVLESEVMLEVENKNGEVVTILRSVKGERDKRLVSVWSGPLLTNPSKHYKQNDYYVLDPGSATKPMGFHNFIANFIGWDLPKVSRFDQPDCPLYLESIFPLIIIEQKHGWGGIQFNLPTFLRIKEMSKRTIEFILKLDAYNLAIEKQELQKELSLIKQKWETKVKECKALIRPINGEIQGVIYAPTVEWPPPVFPYIVIVSDGKWVPVEEAIKKDIDLLQELDKEIIDKPDIDKEKIASELNEERSLLSEKEFVISKLFDEIKTDKKQIEAIDERIIALNEDERKNKDLLKIQKYGSKLSLDYTDGTCPTCHQSVNDSLLPQGMKAVSMPIEDNIEFIKSQKKIFSQLRDNMLVSLRLKEKKFNSFREDINNSRARIRALKRTLISDDRLPSVAAIQKRIILEEKINLRKKVIEDFDICVDQFSDFTTDFKRIQERISLLPKDHLSYNDKLKLKALEKSFINQIIQYVFTSIDPKTIEISEINYKPIREGFNLGFDISASDNIRTIWAYLNALLELSRKFTTNHPGLLIFDEPRQQEASPVSFTELLKQVSTSKEANQQVIFSTSQEEDILLQDIKDLKCQFISFKDKIIKPLTK